MRSFNFRIRKQKTKGAPHDTISVFNLIIIKLMVKLQDPTMSLIR